MHAEFLSGDGLLHPLNPLFFGGKIRSEEVDDGLLRNLIQVNEQHPGGIASGEKVKLNLLSGQRRS